MPETKIKVEISAFKRLFPLYVRILGKRLNFEVSSIKKYKNYFLISTSEKSEEIFKLVSNLYNFNDLYNIQKVIFDYKNTQLNDNNLEL